MSLVAIAFAGTASAVPNVDRVGGAAATFSLVGRDAAIYTVQVTARISEAGTSMGKGVVKVSVTRCFGGSCSAPYEAAAQLAATQLVVASDMSEGSLRLGLFGGPLVLHWGGASSETSADSKAEFYQPVLPQGQVRVWARQSREADASGRVAGVACRARDASLLQEEVVDGVLGSPPPSLPARPPRSMAGLLTARCK